jgi:Uma2 family endonuclease
MTDDEISIKQYLNTSYRPDVEYKDGKLSERPVTFTDHGRLRASISHWFAKHEDDWAIQVALGVRTQVSPSRVRLPDIVVDQIGVWPRDYLVDPPLIVVEVISQNDSYSEVVRLVQDYLQMGIRNIWLVDPETGTGRVCDEIAWTAVNRFEVEGTPIYLDLEEQLARLHRCDPTTNNLRKPRRKSDESERNKDSIFDSEESLRKAGFQGFVSIRELRHDLAAIPDAMGIYMVLHRLEVRPTFKNPGTGGHFKGRNPNLKVELLESNWVEDTPVVYIGKSENSLRARWKTRLRFGAGEPVAAWGGRAIWQLSEPEELVICWKRTPGSPRESERKMIKDFQAKFGKRPFANLRG